MKTDEKLNYFYDCLTAKARSDAGQMLEEQKAALCRQAQKHRDEKEARRDDLLKADALSYQHTLNSTFSEEQLKIRHELTEKTEELTNAVFEEVSARLEAFRLSPEYLPYLCRKIREVINNVSDSDAVCLLSPSDRHLSQAVSASCGIPVSPDSHDFNGGFRILCPGRRLMIDHSFKTRLIEEKEVFVIS